MAASFVKTDLFYVSGLRRGGVENNFYPRIALDEPEFESLHEQDSSLFRNLPTDSKDHLSSNSVGRRKFTSSLVPKFVVRSECNSL